jgi:dTDP-4-dehydrorhamnose reductase
MRLLVTGAAGMLGRATLDAACRRGHDTIGLTRADLDIGDPVAVEENLARHAPEAVINCAAWTDVDGAETELAGAMAGNAYGPGVLAGAAAGTGARLVHVSTDYVFDGSKREPWLESDPVAPVNAYGRSKLAGEEAVLGAGGDAAIVRTAWLYGAGGGNFVDTMLRLGAERDEVSVVTDQIGRPTWTGDLAAALVELAERTGDRGVFHATGSGECSWFDFAVEIFDRARLECRVLPTTSDAFPRPAARPAYSVLGTERDPGVVLGSWQDGLQAYLDEREGATT